jgi:hypothetical protein
MYDPSIDYAKIVVDAQCELEQLIAQNLERTSESEDSSSSGQVPSQKMKKSIKKEKFSDICKTALQGKSGPRRKRTIRRIATQIQKDFKCLFCHKTYGSEAATIMHMRNKHHSGTK